VQPSRIPDEGWHCSHLFYRLDREILSRLAESQRNEGRQQLLAALDPAGPAAPQRLQTSAISGHKADFGLMLMDPDPLKIDALHQAILAGPLGPAIQPTWSFVSLSELSEYVPSVEQYAERLVEEGEVPGSESLEAKVNAYRRREPIMRRQRLTPDFPDWPATCFYPMNKKRVPGENWFTLPFAERSRMMNEHARSGMAFAGKVTQLITVGVGLDDWEWGVTLWAANPQFLTKIVYQMRFDEASARYAEFGPFYVGYVMPPGQLLEHLRV
jgi:chlorite dismutase